MPLNFFAPKPGRFGVLPAYVRSGQIGGTNFLGGATPLTANTTTIFRLGGLAGRSAVFSRLGATAVTVPADADGTILAYVYKFRASDNTAVQMSAALDLEALVTREETFANALGIAEADLTLTAGDAIEIHVVSNSAAIDTQPAGLVFVAEMLVEN